MANDVAIRQLLMANALAISGYWQRGLGSVKCNVGTLLEKL